MSTGNLNIEWGKTVIDQLIKQGVTYFCLAPGLRSTPLAIAIAEESRANKQIHFDERGLAFHALGYAKATRRAAAIIVTSGTAVGNLMPAVMEASSADIPLILLTCDRPPELRDTMANQTADQVKLFGGYLRYFFDLPPPSISISPQFLATTIAQAVCRTLFPIAGPVQLNCPYPEPLFNEATVSAATPLSTQYTLPELYLSKQETEKWTELFEKTEKGVIVVGANGWEGGAIDLAKILSWPILPDIASNYRSAADPLTIPYYGHLLKEPNGLKADLVLYLGDPCVSKVLLHWIAKQPRLIHVAKHPKRGDPNHCVTDRIIANPTQFCEQTTPKVGQKKGNSWLHLWQKGGALIFPNLSSPHLTEPGVIECLLSVATEGKAFFFGNSMPVRDADLFFFPQAPCGPLFANRGLSGIDGNLATCSGIAKEHPLIALIGDQTCLHDLNSLSLIKKAPHPIHLIVINNGGGGIFSFVAGSKRPDLLDSYFAAAHSIEFEDAASLFDLPYFYAKTKEELKSALSSEVSCLIEVKTNRSDNLELHQQIDATIQRQLCGFFSTVS